MYDLTPARRAQLASIQRLGGLSTALRPNLEQTTAQARAAFDRTFGEDHSCAVCPPTTGIPELPDFILQRRALARRRRHFARMAYRRWS